MLSRTAPRRSAKYALVAVSIGLGALGCLWVLRFLMLLTLGNEVGALPPVSRIPSLPAGATIVAEGKGCGSGGCWREITVVPAAGQSPEDLTQEMDLAEEQRRSPTLLDPGFVYVWAHPKDGQLVIGVGYQ
jgi:hypothetical protein